MDLETQSITYYHTDTPCLPVQLSFGEQHCLLLKGKMKFTLLFFSFLDLDEHQHFFYVIPKCLKADVIVL